MQDFRQGGAQLRAFVGLRMRKPKMLPLRFPYAPGSASGCSFIEAWRWSGVWRHVLREYIGLQRKFLRQFLRTYPDRRRVALHVTVGDREAFFTRNSN